MLGPYQHFYHSRMRALISNKYLLRVSNNGISAIINNNGKVFLVGSNGKLSKNDFLNNKLPFIFGKPDINEFLNFKKIIDQSKFSYNEITNLYFFPSKRWDLELRNNRIIKLSQNFTKETLEPVSYTHLTLPTKRIV